MNLSKKSKLFLVLLVVSVLAIYFGYKTLYKSPETTNELGAEFYGTSQLFIKTVKKSTSYWEGKIVKLTGVITAKEEQGLIIDTVIYCQFTDTTLLKTITPKQTITIKARFIGYDELLDEFKLNQSIIIQ